MSVQLSHLVMVCVEVPRELWVMVNPAAPKYMTCVDGFYEWADEGGLLHDDRSPGEFAILYDGMSSEYCWFGVLVAKTNGHRESVSNLRVPAIRGGDITVMQEALKKRFAKVFPGHPCPQPLLRFINHYH